MNTQAFNTAQAAYQRGDWATAASALAATKAPGEVSGKVDHLLGNSLMKLGRYEQAAQAYASALADAAYGHVGALNCNRGRALAAVGRADEAVACFEAAVADPDYPTPHKAYVALGKLYSKAGMPREAGTAWRNAAIDETNPDPSAALVQLGACFMQLGRPVDAVEAYRTALDFSQDAGQGSIYADLGMAYMAANRVSEAADAFTQALADPSYQLTDEQRASFSSAQKALAAVQAGGPSETDQLLANAGYGDDSGLAAPAPDASGALDPLDPMGKSGEFIPSPEDTGFFSVTEEDLMNADKHERRMRRKHSHMGLKVFLVIFFLLVVLGGGGGFAYYKGFGWPTQESVVTDMFTQAAAGDDIAPYLADGVSDDARSQIEAIMPLGATAKVAGLDRTMTSSTALVEATLSDGGTQSYKVTLVRSGLGWKVSGVELSFPSGTSSSGVATTGTLATTGSTASTGTTATSDGAGQAAAEQSAQSPAAGTEATATN